MLDANDRLNTWLQAESWKVEEGQQVAVAKVEEQMARARVVAVSRSTRSAESRAAVVELDRLLDIAANQRRWCTPRAVDGGRCARGLMYCCGAPPARLQLGCVDGMVFALPLTAYAVDSVDSGEYARATRRRRHECQQVAELATHERLQGLQRLKKLLARVTRSRSRSDFAGQPSERQAYPQQSLGDEHDEGEQNQQHDRQRTHRPNSPLE